MIRHLLLDLDNTLYPASQPMDDGISRRMREYVARVTGLPLAEATALRAKRLPAYGTTLEWLKREYAPIDEHHYFETVHPEEEIGELEKDPRLRDYLRSLGLPMTILTNAPIAHAKRVLRHLNVEDLFLGVFDITWHKGVGKPDADCFRNTLAAVGQKLEETLFVDDMLKYVLGFRALQGQVALVDESGAHAREAHRLGIPCIASIYELKDLLATL